MGLVYKFCLHETDGFSVRKISSTLNTTPDWQTEHTEIPGGPYTYLGRGAQVFAFVSKDKQYVLKFYRQNRAGHPLSFLRPVLPSQLQKRLLSTIEKRKNKRLKDFSSFMLAYHSLRAETGLVALQLNPTSTPMWVMIYDKIGIEHKLDISQMQCILQKFAEPIYESLENWISLGKKDLAKEQLSLLIELLKSRCQKGIFDKDPDLKTNFGFTKEGPIQFDIGRFKIDPERSDPKIYRKDLIRIMDKLCQWLEPLAPELSDHVKKEIAKA